ncbi:outer dynein arm-docking complex subunit 3-like [Antennarius striatus]|uniref:outer dynein arm-docking complex subunit 3-like n=1 Tax=Antennarius striatus TaxID=241820 RepID=UPI0035ADAE54
MTSSLSCSCCALIGSHYPRCKNEMNSLPQGQSEEKENSPLAHSSHQEKPALSSKEEEPSPDQTFKLLPRMPSEADAHAKRIEEEVRQFENGEKRLMVEKIFEVLARQAATVHKWLTKLEEYVRETQPSERKLWKEEELISSKLHEQTMLNKELQKENASIKALLAQTMHLLSTAQGTVSSCEQAEDTQTNKHHLEGRNLETTDKWEQEKEWMQKEIQSAKYELQAVLMDMTQLQLDLQGSIKTTRRTHTRNQMSITPPCSVKALLAQTVNHLSVANIHQRQAQATISRYEQVDPHRSGQVGKAARKLLQVEDMQTNKPQIDGQGDRS